ncbi:TonB-dependent receptor [Pseudoduganella sp. FT26W]|uniref:TonB-dependent receptor n=1 Tax=Duganella aquatilis TaxID=2666082 RepID=A0A844D356_9BURK|nr:TonB-dependent receptor [Duganella aquatilis]MRW83102.1 TonB-dependent receptor [Duganella aquatilis]
MQTPLISASVTGLALLCAGAAAQAQTQTPPATPVKPAVSAEISKKPEEKPADDSAMQRVDVVAQRPNEQIDRSVYDLKQEVITPAASAADVIANVPNVTVDQDGKVAIRGNQNTQIFVDGKRSAMFSGANAGDALNSYPAEALESVEVITVPGAEFGSEGGGGPILNLITRRVRPKGGQGAVSAGIGQSGRHNASIVGSYNEGRYQIEGQAGINSNINSRTGWSNSLVNSGPTTSSTLRDGSSRSDSNTFMLNPTFTYNVGETDRARLALNYNRTNSDNESLYDYLTYQGAPTPYQQYQQRSNGNSHMTVYQLAFTYEQKFNRTDKLSYDFRTSGNNREGENRNLNSYTILPPTGPRAQFLNGNNNTSRLSELSMDYTKALTPMVLLTAGVKAGINTGQTDADYFNIDPLTGEEIIDVDRASAFKTTEHSYAVYVTTNAKLTNHWTIKPGLRYEKIDRDIEYINQNNSGGDSSKRLMPSMFVQYAWGELGNSTLTGAYTRRITRPSLADINPNVQYVNDTSYTLGDPRIAPMHGDKYELKYDDKSGWLNYTITPYREKDSPLIGRALTPVPGTAIVISEAMNYGAKTTNGVSINFQGRPDRSLNFGATINLQHLTQSVLANQYNTDGTRYTKEFELVSNPKIVQLRAQYTTGDHTFQLNGNYNGKRLNGLSQSDTTWQVNPGWSWRLAPGITLRSSIRDLFNSNVNHTIQYSDTVQSESYSRQAGRVYTVALSFSLGGVTGDSRLRNGNMFRGQPGEGGTRGPGQGGNGGGGGSRGFPG